jgi:hypothetical protein
MEEKNKYILKVLLIPTIAWFAFLVIFHLTITDDAIQLMGLSSALTEIPVWTVHLLSFLGYVISLLIGLVSIYEKKHWKLY